MQAGHRYLHYLSSSEHTSIVCRAEMQIAGEETLQALRNANDALVEISSESSPAASSRRDKRQQEAAEREVELIPCHKPQCPGLLHVIETQL